MEIGEFSDVNSLDTIARILLVINIDRYPCRYDNLLQRYSPLGTTERLIWDLRFVIEQKLYLQ